MRVFLNPVGLYSRAMVRISNALKQYAPEGVEIVNNKSTADLCVMYVIGYDFVDWAYDLLNENKHYAVVQCCTVVDPSPNQSFRYSSWEWLWNHASVVWSFNDLGRLLEPKHYNFYYAPLGVDRVFAASSLNGHLRQSVITTGYVSSPQAEAIEEVWIAAGICNLPVIHIGPNKVQGIEHKPSHVTCIEGVTDDQLAWYYSGAKWVVSLRHTEGFELPALEGICSGARGVLFAQRDLHHWYKGHAAYVPECHGEELVNRLIEVFRSEPEPVTQDEQREVMRRFDWKAICGGFWTSLLRERVSNE